MLGDLRAVPRGGCLPAAPREQAVLVVGVLRCRWRHWLQDQWLTVDLQGLNTGRSLGMRMFGHRASDREQTSVLLLGWGRVHLQSYLLDSVLFPKATAQHWWPLFLGDFLFSGLSGSSRKILMVAIRSHLTCWSTEPLGGFPGVQFYTPPRPLLWKELLVSKAENRAAMGAVLQWRAVTLLYFKK